MQVSITCRARQGSASATLTKVENPATKAMDRANFMRLEINSVSWGRAFCESLAWARKRTRIVTKGRKENKREWKVKKREKKRNSGNIVRTSMVGCGTGHVLEVVEFFGRSTGALICSPLLFGPLNSLVSCCKSILIWTIPKTSCPQTFALFGHIKDYLFHQGTEGNFLTMAFRSAICWVPKAKQVVTTAGRPSGMAATAKATAILK